MGRWEPDALGRLERAAMELFAERGFDRTTVAEIAERAGLTERTFFRHYADKRDVLFGGAGSLQTFLVDQVDEAPPSLSPYAVVVRALVEVATVVFEERRAFARQRQAIIAASVELQEREEVKLATLAGALADALRRRGVEDLAAGLVANAGIVILKVAFEGWTDDPNGPALAEWIRASAGELAAATSGVDGLPTS
ncbi:MAG TPA: TetR family transcriptional regulator [Acidimicrobiia bacterium]|nr:TetR family transcriptional regulator [Acidimicrobiia bacterium]